MFKNNLTIRKAVNKLNQTIGDVFVDTALCDRLRKINQEINFIKNSGGVKRPLY